KKSSTSSLNFSGCSIMGAWQHLSMNLREERGINRLNSWATMGGVMVSFNPQTSNVGTFIFGISSARLLRWADLAMATMRMHLGMLFVISNTSSTSSLVATSGL